jgi:hypothetical protein
LHGVWQGVIIVFVCFITLDRDQDFEGRMADIWAGGLFVYTCVVVIANGLIVYLTNTHSFWSQLWAWGSIIVFYFIIIVMSYGLASTDLYGTLHYLAR